MSCRPLIRDLIRTDLRGLLQRRGGFSPSSVFSGGAAGMWLDPSDITTGYTDSAGLTQQTASGQQTGMRLDKRLGTTFGPEVVTNGTFDSGTTGWTPNEATLSVVGGQLQLLTAGVGGFNTSCSQTITTVIGTTYTIRGRLYKGTCVNTVQVVIGAATAATNATTTPTDFAFTYTAVGTSTVIRLACAGNETGTTAFFDTIGVKAWTGNHVTQSTGAARPEYDVITGISSDFFDGSDDGYSTATFVAGTLTAAMDCFVAFKRATATGVVFSGGATADPRIALYDGTAGASNLNSGTPTMLVNGVAVPGGTAVTGVQLQTALTLNTWVVLEVRDLDLSAWTSFRVSSVIANAFNADVGGIILSPAQSTANRAALRKWLGAKVGLAL